MKIGTRGTRETETQCQVGLTCLKLAHNSKTLHHRTKQGYSELGERVLGRYSTYLDLVVVGVPLRPFSAFVSKVHAALFFNYSIWILALNGK